MIISASRRTDIPACYPEWFMNRIREGFFHTTNPFNPKQVSCRSLLPTDVDIIVFWTKNPKPLVPYLPELDQRGYRYYFQYTLNDYPSWLEPGLPPVNERIEAFVHLSNALGPERVIWRYDPIILSTETPVDYHIERIGCIAEHIRGYTERLTISFLDFYSKIKGRIQKTERDRQIRLWDLVDGHHGDDLDRLCRAISEISCQNRLEVVTCCEKVDLGRYGIRHGSCIDARLIKRLIGTDKDFTKDPGQRSDCLCAISVDMGAYNTCRNGCTYCYANLGEKAVARNVSRHLASSPSLL
ncbi:MAG: DUF1848 domain-containing protein [Firmicutes bacterium]|jgi:DNA repair photolyase|nr:DUF1848 domain-containing protein [Bacillota bacterium]